MKKTMKKYIIKHLNCKADEINWEEIEKAEITCLPWPEFGKLYYSYGQVVELETSIAIRMYAEENELRCENVEDNSPVNQDSCLEFFLMPYDDGPYFNFEINPNGCMKVKVGYNKTERKFITTPGGFKEFFNIASEIRNDCWIVSYEIPKSFLFGSQDIPKQFRGNFFKCGDLTVIPHYQCWSEIAFTEKPNFHIPDCFGLFEFEVD